MCCHVQDRFPTPTGKLGLPAKHCKGISLPVPEKE